MKDGKFDLKTFLNNIELYIGTICFFILTVMLMLQVVSRYVLKHPYVKPTTKKFITFFEAFRAAI